MLRDWDKLPVYMQTRAVEPYYNKLKKKKIPLFLKRIFDIILSAVLLIGLSPALLILSIIIAIDSEGGVFFRQERITQYGRKFRIHKFRTMVENAEQLGSHITICDDIRVTRVGEKLRRYRLDELPQLIDIFLGNMSFVGTRPEVTKYVRHYTPEMMATLLLPAGLTSEASIKYKDEAKLLEGTDDADEVYVNQVLPEKMKYNLESLMKFSLRGEFLVMIKTVITVAKKHN